MALNKTELMQEHSVIWWEWILSYQIMQIFINNLGEMIFKILHF